MTIEIADKVGTQVTQNRGPVVIGLSIRNSYFTEDNLQQLLAWSQGNFRYVYIMIPDKPAIHTLQALGYNFKRAKEKTVLASNNLENKCKRIIASLNAANQLTIIRWDNLEANSSYITALEKLTKLYQTDAVFQEDARAATAEVLDHNASTSPPATATDIGVQFLLMELAFILYSADILDQTSTAYVYHKRMPILENLLSGKYNYIPPGNTGYIVAQVEA